MARKKNTSFQGVSVYDTDVDSPTFRRAVENITGDVALTYDRLTGENGETNTINHSAPQDGRGASLRVPLVNQYIGRNIGLTSPSGKDTSGGTGRTIVLPYIVFVPSGETNLSIRVWIDSLDSNFVYQSGWRCEIRNSSTNAVEDSQDMGWIQESDGTFRIDANFESVGSGLKLIFISVDTGRINDYFTGTTVGVADIGRLISCSIYCPGRRMGSLAPVINESNDYGVTAPASGSGVSVTPFDASMFAGPNLYDPIDGYTLSRLNRSINGLLEYTTGFPAGGNNTYTHVDSGASNPTASRFHAPTRAPYTSQGTPDFPLWAESFGSFIASGFFSVNLAEPPTSGMLQWYAPWPITTAIVYASQVPVQFPDFPSSSSTLRVSMLLGSEGSATAANWTVRVLTGAGSASAVPASIDATNDFWVGTATAVPFTGDASDFLSVGTSRTGAKTGIGEVCVLAACAYYVRQ